MPRYRSDCAQLESSSCKSRPERCTVVRKSSRAPGALPDPAERSEERREEAERAVPRAPGRAAPLPRDRAAVRVLSLRQRPNACFLAAATLAFGRVALPYARSRAVRDYVRNPWPTHGRRPRARRRRRPVAVPKDVRQYYAALYDHLLTRRVKYNSTKVYTREQMDCARSGSTEKKLLLVGASRPVSYRPLLGVRHRVPLREAAAPHRRQPS